MIVWEEIVPPPKEVPVSLNVFILVWNHFRSHSVTFSEISKYSLTQAQIDPLYFTAFRDLRCSPGSFTTVVFILVVWASNLTLGMAYHTNKKVCNILLQCHFTVISPSLISKHIDLCFLLHKDCARWSSQIIFQV